MIDDILRDESVEALRGQTEELVHMMRGSMRRSRVAFALYFARICSRQRRADARQRSRAPTPRALRRHARRASPRRITACSATRVLEPRYRRAA